CARGECYGSSYDFDYW
nr:immunoglobulin heavy chain junction region [Mus musculus]MBK4196461.1 immunoglobulin heavy chain junction region [Mus musculus]